MQNAIEEVGSRGTLKDKRSESPSPRRTPHPRYPRYPWFVPCPLIGQRGFTGEVETTIVWMKSMNGVYGVILQNRFSGTISFPWSGDSDESGRLRFEENSTAKSAAWPLGEGDVPADEGGDDRGGDGGGEVEGGGIFEEGQGDQRDGRGEVEGYYGIRRGRPPTPENWTKRKLAAATRRKTSAGARRPVMRGGLAGATRGGVGRK